MIVSITHGEDIDGIGAQAILLRYFQLNRKDELEAIILEYAHYSNLIQKLNALLDSSKPPKELYISDLGFNNEFMAVFTIFKKLKNLNCKIYWFDHHIVSDEIRERIENSIDLYLNDHERCGAEIMKDHLLPDDPIAQQIGVYARDRDFQYNEIPLAHDLDSLIAFYRDEKYKENQRSLVKLLSEGVFENDWINNQIAEFKAMIKVQNDKAVKQVEIIKIEDFGKLALTFAELGASQITRHVELIITDLEFYASIDSRHYEINIHSEYANCRDIAAHFEGGGHKNRAGFSYQGAVKNNEINPTFKEELITLIKKNKQ